MFSIEGSVLKSYVEFRTDLFPPCSENTDEWEGAVWGRSLAIYLNEKLKQSGIPSAGICAEDWGYIVNFGAPFDSNIWIGCGKYEEYKDGYLLIIEPKKAIIKRWFKPNIDLTQQLEQLTDALKQILEAEPLIHDIKWWTAEEFEK